MDLENLFLKDIFRNFDFNVEKLTMNKLGNSSNLIYEFKDGNKEYILRISKNKLEKLSYYEGEMNFINYLFLGKGNVSRVIPSKSNNLVEYVKYDGEYYFISIFEKAKGHSPDINDEKEWNNELFYKWGEAMGKFHALSKCYSQNDIKILRNQWNEDIYFNEEFSMKDKDNSIYEIWNKILVEIKSLPKDKNSYGLIHYDFHHYNFFIDNGKIVIFDFDDCLYHWFVCDIAIAIYHAIEVMGFTNHKEKNLFAYNFIKNFMEGYLSQTYIHEYWIEKIPIFLEYRRICSYSFMYKLLEGKNLDERKKYYMEKRREEIKNRVQYVDFNFKYNV